MSSLQISDLLSHTNVRDRVKSAKLSLSVEEKNELEKIINNVDGSLFNSLERDPMFEELEQEISNLTPDTDLKSFITTKYLGDSVVMIEKRQELRRQHRRDHLRSRRQNRRSTRRSRRRRNRQSLSTRPTRHGGKSMKSKTIKRRSHRM